MKKFILVFVCMFILLSLSSGLLISPAKLQLSYSETPVNFDVTIYNDLDQDVQIEISFESYENKKDYNDYLKIKNFNSNIISVPALGNKVVNFEMNYPEFQEFGYQRFAVIRFYQVPLNPDSQVGATVAILIPVESEIPYPEKFVKVTMSDFGIVKKGDNILLNATLENLGENLSLVNGKFVLGGSLEFGFEDLSLVKGESSVVFANVDTSNLESGIYDVVVNLNYDSFSSESEPSQIIIGERNVQLLNFNPKELKVNKVNSVYLTVASLWIDDISPEFDADLIKNGNSIQNFDIGVYTLQVSEKKDIYFAMDLGNLEIGDYVLRVNSNVDGIETYEDFNINLISEDLDYAPVENESNISLVFVAVCLMVFIIIFLIVVIGYLIYTVKSKNEI